MTYKKGEKMKKLVLIMALLSICIFIGCKKDVDIDKKVKNKKLLDEMVIVEKVTIRRYGSTIEISNDNPFAVRVIGNRTVYAEIAQWLVKIEPGKTALQRATHIYHIYDCNGVEIGIAK
jgi:hypothetical protein